MLEPLYKLAVTGDAENGWQVSTPPAGFAVIYYARVAGYTLVGYQISSGGEAIAGENLWHQGRPIASGGGRLQLISTITPDAKRNTNLPPGDLWETIPYREIEVPSQVAIALREPKNQRWLTT